MVIATTLIMFRAVLNMLDICKRLLQYILLRTGMMLIKGLCDVMIHNLKQHILTLYKKITQLEKLERQTSDCVLISLKIVNYSVI